MLQAAASVLGCVLTLQLGAFSVTLETLASGITELPFQTFVAVMQSIHLAIGLVEGLITAAVLCFVYEARPELLWGTDESTQRQKARFSLKKTVAILAVLTVWIGGGLFRIMHLKTVRAWQEHRFRVWQELR